MKPALTFLITAGPTIEDIDPVRFISNRATGKLGVELGCAALKSGHRVIFVHGPIHDTVLSKLPKSKALRCVPVRSAAQMHAAVMENVAEVDAVVMNAAVADYTPVQNSPLKLKKSGQALVLKLKPTVDILAELGRLKASDKLRFLLFGFALETGSGGTESARKASQLAEARRKLATKHLDAIVLDTPAEMGAGRGTFTLFDKTNTPRIFRGVTKSKLAWEIVAYCNGHMRDE